jgi:Protein of unknown function (DUF2971)
MIEESESQQGNYVERLRKQMQSERVGPGLTPPSELFHYTTADALVGIIKADAIWATNFRYVNDLTEFTYANELLQREMKRDINSQALSPQLYAAFNHIIESPEMLLAGADVYLACFCEQGNLLSQWRAYGSRGGGYAMGLNATTASLGGMNPRHSLYRVTYNEEQQLRLIRFLLDAYERDVVDFGGSLSPRSFQRATVYLSGERGPNRLRSSFEGAIGELTVALAEAFVEIACFFKNSHFTEEQEWRLVHRARGTDGEAVFGLNFRCAGSTIVPYVSIPLALNLHGIHPGSCVFTLERIIFGPGLSQSVTEQSLKMLLSRYVCDAKIEQSNIKVRV